MNDDAIDRLSDRLIIFGIIMLLFSFLNRFL